MRFSSNDEQKILKQLTGKSLNRTEARNVWSKVQDHKWYVSERLGRDVGFRVAAVDFVENIYRASVSQNGNAPHNPNRDSRLQGLIA